MKHNSSGIIRIGGYAFATEIDHNYGARYIIFWCGTRCTESQVIAALKRVGMYQYPRFK